MVAVTLDDVEQIRALQIPDEQIMQMRFEDGMNILNLAIDQLKFKVVKYLATFNWDIKN